LSTWCIDPLDPAGESFRLSVTSLSARRVCDEVGSIPGSVTEEAPVR